MFTEYVKLLFARVRMGLSHAPAANALS
jgi:hypothetical protein